MKAYKPEALVAVSRYQNFFPTLDQQIRIDVYTRMHKLIEEEKEYCDKGNYSHMGQILTSIALYEVLQKHGKSEDEAYRIVSEEMWKFLDPSSVQKMAKKSFFLPLMKKSVPFTDFIRTKTLCQGGDLCDFLFVRHETDAGDGWERSNSI